MEIPIHQSEAGKAYLTGMSQHFRKAFPLVGLTRYAEIVEPVEEITEGQ